MTVPFAPEKPEKMIIIEASGKEANLIDILRRYPFGKFIITKAKNRLVRIEITESRFINDDSRLALEVK